MEFVFRRHRWSWRHQRTFRISRCRSKKKHHTDLVRSKMDDGHCAYIIVWPKSRGKRVQDPDCGNCRGGPIKVVDPE